MAEDILTGVDKLLELLKQKKKISMKDAAKHLSLPVTVINEWADFLNEEKIIKIEYGIRNQILVLNETSEKDIKIQKEEVQKSKETLLRKILTISNIMGKRRNEFSALKEEFEKVKNDIEKSTSSLSKEIDAVKSLDEKKSRIKAEFASSSSAYEKKINELLEKMQEEEKEYSKLVQKFSEKEKSLKEIETEKKSLTRKENEIKKKLSSLLSSVASIEQRLHEGLRKEAYSKEQLGDIKKNLEKVSGRIDKGKHELKKLQESLAKSEKESENRLKFFFNQIENKINIDEKEKEQLKRSVARFEEFMSKMNSLVVFINKVEKDFSELSRKISNFEKKIKIVAFVTNKGEYNRHMQDIKQHFSSIEKLKDTIDEDLKNLKKKVKG